MNTQKSRENLIYLILWIMVFTFPIFLSTGGNRIDWVRVVRELLRILPFFLVFIFNNFLFFNYFRGKRYSRYFLLTGITVLALSYAGTLDAQIYKLFGIPPAPAAPGPRDFLRTLDTFFYDVIFSILVIGLNDAVKISFDWFREKRNYEELQKENLKNQMALLQNQINPHFLMNTLNNIHALIDYDRQIAKHSVMKLSRLMRVLLYENENYTLEKEIGFLKDYIELMKIRLNPNVELVMNYPEILPAVSLSPLLFVSFVENSFKHGIRASGRSFIHISITLEGDYLDFIIENSNNDKSIYGGPVEKIGLANARKRLDLIYGDDYTFRVNETVNSFEVRVKIPLHENKMPGR